MYSGLLPPAWKALVRPHAAGVGGAVRLHPGRFGRSAAVPGGWPGLLIRDVQVRRKRYVFRVHLRADRELRALAEGTPVAEGTVLRLLLHVHCSRVERCTLCGSDGRLCYRMQPRRLFLLRWGSYHKLAEGQVSLQSSQIRRIVHMRCNYVIIESRQ
jgi:hypothetical protein